eukprot:403336540
METTDKGSTEQLRQEKLNKLITQLEEKRDSSEEFRKQYDINFRALFNPQDSQFNEIYATEDLAKDNLYMAVQLKAQTRNLYIFGTFLSYHLVKSVLWRYGYFATFFYRQRFLSIPVLIAANVWNVKKTLKDCDEAGILDYTRKRLKFNKDKEIVEKLLKSRLQLNIEHQALEGNAHKISDLINEIQK